MPVPFFGQGSGTPVQVLVGRGRPSLNISKYVDLDGGGLKIEDTGNQADDGATVELLDIGRLIDDIGPEARLLVKTGAEERFRGFVRQFTPKPFTRSNRIILNAVGVSSLLDTSIIPPGSAYTRSKAESDRARILWLLKTFGHSFLSHASNDFSRIQVLERGMEKQKFGSLTLRQAIEQVLAASSESANYYVDQQGRLVTWDNDHLDEEDAPYEVNTVESPAANEITPQNLEITWDTAELVNYYIVRGQNRAGSGEFSDEESIELYGRRQAFLDGPDSDTARKARRLGRAALNDTKNPTERVSFTVDDTQITRNGVVWQPGQRLFVTAPGFGWLRHKLRIVRVTSRYIDSTGRRAMDIEAGAFRRSFINSFFGGGSSPRFPPGHIPGGPSIRPVPPWDLNPTPDEDFDPDVDREPCFPCPEGATLTPARVGSPETGNMSSSFRPLTIGVPDGADVPGRSLVVFLSHDITEAGLGSASSIFEAYKDGILAALPNAEVIEEASWLSLVSAGSDSFGHHVFWLKLDGTEFPSVGASFQLDLAAVIPDQVTARWVLVLYDDVNAVAGSIAATGSSKVVPGFTPSWNGGRPAVWLAHGSSADTIGDVAPTGFTALHSAGDLFVGQNSGPVVAERDGSNDSQPFSTASGFSGGGSGHVLGYLVLGGTTPREGENVTDSFTGDGVTTTFRLSTTLLAFGEAKVDGVTVPNTLSSTTSHSITFDAAPASGAKVKVSYHAGS